MADGCVERFAVRPEHTLEVVRVGPGFIPPICDGKHLQEARLQVVLPGVLSSATIQLDILGDSMVYLEVQER